MHGGAIVPRNERKLVAVASEQAKLAHCCNVACTELYPGVLQHQVQGETHV